MARSAKTAESSVKLMFLFEAQGQLPSEVNLSDCSLDYLEEKKASDLITGIYGAKSKQIALESASKWNTRHSMTPKQLAKGIKQPGRMLIIDAQYAVNSLESQRQRVSEETLAKDGWLNMDRLTPAFREDLREQWLRWIARSQGKERAMKLREDEVDLLQIAEDYPQFIPTLFKSHENLIGVQHPVRPRFDREVALWAATVRMTPARFMDVRARFFDEMKVKVA